MYHISLLFHKSFTAALSRKKAVFFSVSPKFPENPFLLKDFYKESMTFLLFPCIIKENAFLLKGGQHGMKLISWNVNGLRACMGKGFLAFLKASDADIVCLQETKMQREQADFIISGYKEYWNSA